jgi:hypothetical protein
LGRGKRTLEHHGEQGKEREIEVSLSIRTLVLQALDAAQRVAIELEFAPEGVELGKLRMTGVACELRLAREARHGPRRTGCQKHKDGQADDPFTARPNRTLLHFSLPNAQGLRLPGLRESLAPRVCAIS